ncbi:serine/threonine protein kinase [Gemmatimonas sp.]|jgi:serine/threonine protein kinase|uniref:serine/threonine protein kinase n=1 Tax=Gemmatimonas sp. TaxID=1962908 RepID=UPI0037BFD8E1
MTSTIQYLQHAKDVLARRYSTVTFVAENASGFIFSARTGDEAAAAVVIKVAYPNSGVPGISDMSARFHRECEIGAQLHHPHIVRVSPSEVIDGIEFFEMSAGGGYRLDHLVQATNPPSYDRILTIMKEIAEALDYAHAEGIIHGNLRPSVVHLDETGHVHVRGFLLYEGKDAPHPGLSPAVIGNAAYMPPEQWHDVRVDRRVDVYAAGILAYELCTGHARVDHDANGMAEVHPIELLPNQPLRDGVPLHAVAAIRRATNRDAVIRFASIGAFVDALRNAEQALGHSLPTIAPPVAPERTAPWMLILLVVAVAIGTAIIVPSKARTRVFEWTASRVNPTSATEGASAAAESRIVPTIDTRTQRGPGSTSRERSTGPDEQRRDSTRTQPPSPLPSPVPPDRQEDVSARTPRASASPATIRSARAIDNQADATREVITDRNSASTASGRAVQTGVLLVSADQGNAVVLVNGIPRGTTPLALSLSPGTYRVSLRSARTYDPREMRISVARADTAYAEFYATNALPDDTTSAPRPGAGNPE